MPSEVVMPMISTTHSQTMLRTKKKKEGEEALLERTPPIPESLLCIHSHLRDRKFAGSVMPEQGLNLDAAQT